MAQLPQSLYPLLLKLEGGYVNNQHDHGGATKWGVTQRVFNYYYPKGGDVSGMTSDEWKFIISKYWQQAGALYLNNPGAATMVFDWFWGSGFEAIKRIQRHFGLAPDGYFGNNTAARVNGLGDSAIQVLHDLRKEHFEAIVSAEPDQKIFLHGWLNRLEEVTQFAHSLNTGGNV